MMAEVAGLLYSKTEIKHLQIHHGVKGVQIGLA